MPQPPGLCTCCSLAGNEITTCLRLALSHLLDLNLNITASEAFLSRITGSNILPAQPQLRPIFFLFQMRAPTRNSLQSLPASSTFLQFAYFLLRSPTRLWAPKGKRPHWPWWRCFPTTSTVPSAQELSNHCQLSNEYTVDSAKRLLRTPPKCPLSQETRLGNHSWSERTREWQLNAICLWLDWIRNKIYNNKGQDWDHKGTCDTDCTSEKSIVSMLNFLSLIIPPL